MSTIEVVVAVVVGVMAWWSTSAGSAASAAGGVGAGFASGSVGAERLSPVPIPEVLRLGR